MVFGHRSSGYVDTRPASEMWAVEIFFSPWVWKKWVRRAFLLTLPISGPLYLAAFVTTAVVLAPFMLIGILCLAVHEIWTGD